MDKLEINDRIEGLNRALDQSHPLEAGYQELKDQVRSLEKLLNEGNTGDSAVTMHVGHDSTTRVLTVAKYVNFISILKLELSLLDDQLSDMEWAKSLDRTAEEELELNNAISRAASVTNTIEVYTNTL